MRISIGTSRKDTHWKVKDVSWGQLVERLSKPVVTQETLAEYHAMSKDDKAQRKDVGGFVGGVVKGGRRTKNNIACRTLITLDADYARKNAWESVSVMFDYRMCCYSTHSHTPNNPRLRFVVPLDREVTPEEYEPIARKVASDCGIEQFDVTTYDVGRLMYWPSCPRDVAFEFHEQDGPVLSADEVLASYTDWHDTHEWPIASSETVVRAKSAKAQGDPETKPGMVGVFCRTYDVPSAIATFLPDVYTPCEDLNRYTYTGGSTTGGLALYEGGKFAYSHHATDPASGQLCNSFDLVRLHKFRDLDADTDADTPVNKLPSYKAMLDFASEDPTIRETLIGEKLEGAKAAFGEDDPDLDWTRALKVNKNGAVEATTDNIKTIIENDPNLAGCCAMNEFTNRPCIVKDVPWRRCEDRLNGTPWTDLDDSALRYYIEKTYGIYSSGKVTDALNATMLSHAFHPVRSYLEGLRWDGTKRAEKLFIHYMGAEDTPYVRAVTRKWLTAAVARIMRPGVKFDNMVVLVGAQGIGKSYLGSRLGSGWFSDTFNTLQGKEAYEQLKGAWIIEMGELSAMRRAEVEAVKMFISKQEDNYRAAYGRHTQINKRQCVFYGTTNDYAFLHDYTGNRRFWPIGVDKSKALYDVFSLTAEDIDQIWAEAVSWYAAGEPLYLSAEIASLAAEVQTDYMVDNPKEGMIMDYLETPIPENWKELSKTERRNYIQGYLTPDENIPLVQRKSVSVVEMAYELFGEDNLEAYRAKEYHAIMGSMKKWIRRNKRQRSIYGLQQIYERIRA